METTADATAGETVTVLLNVTPGQGLFLAVPDAVFMALGVSRSRRWNHRKSVEPLDTS